jgi:poly-beta-hydroxyalkanoate depolymerase
MSSELFGSPIDARTAPTAVSLHSAKRSSVKPAPSSSKHR